MHKKLGVGLLVAGGLALAGCGSSGSNSSSSSSSGATTASAATSTSAGATSSTATAGAASGGKSVNVGTGTPLKMNGSKLNIAFLGYGDTDTYLQGDIKGAQDEAAKVGANITVLLSNFSPQTQLNQIQTVLSSGKYNAIIIQPLSGQEVCTPLTKDAPAKGIAVTVITEPICNSQLKPLAQQAVPGILGNFVTQSTQSYEQWADHTLSVNPSVKHIAVISGTALSPATAQLDEAVKEALKKHPGVTLDATYATDDSTPSGLQVTQTMLQAHPDVQMILSAASGATVGAAKAIAAAGKTGKVFISDNSGAAVVLPYIKSGIVQLTAVSAPSKESAAAVQTLAAAFAGKPLPYGRSAIADLLKDGQPQYVTKSNLASYTGAY
jgi:ribose transport system substrate-binding protein